MKKIKDYKLFLEQEELDYDSAIKLLGDDTANEMVKEFNSIVKFIDEKSKLIDEYKEELSTHLSDSKDKNTQVDDVYVNLDLINKNISDLKSNLDSITKSLKDYLEKGQNFLY